MRTAVYSGSFNPLHIGHLAIIKHLIEKAGFGCVYLIVSPKNPLKENISAGSGRERYNAAVEAVKRHFSDGSKVIVDDIELTMPAPHYTIRTLDSLKEREPDKNFTLIIGGDNLANIRQWKDYSRLLSEYGVAVFPRTGTDLGEVRKDLLMENPEFKIDILKAEMVDMSSTTIRNAISEGKDVSEWLM